MSANPSRRGRAARAASTAAAAAAVLLLPAAARAQCPTGAICYFGTDITGSSTTRATNVLSLAARNSFFGSLTGVGTEDFEGQVGQGTPLGLVFPGAGAATLTGGGSVVSQGAGTNGVGRYPTSGVAFFEATSAAAGGTTFTINFANPVAAFGFYGIDIGEFGSQLSLRFGLVGGGFSDWQLPYVATNGTDTPRDGSLLYAGFINTQQFTSVQFIGTNATDVFGFDDMTIGSIEQVTLIPEPATWMLLAGGIAAVGAVSRRRVRS